jgi:hypothetical protein
MSTTPPMSNPKNAAAKPAIDASHAANGSAKPDDKRPAQQQHGEAGKPGQQHGGAPSSSPKPGAPKPAPDSKR